MIFTSKRRSPSGLAQPTLLAPPFCEDDITPTDSAAGAGDEAGELIAASVTARWLVLTTDINRRFARALLPEPLIVPERPRIAVWIVDPLSTDSNDVEDPFGRLFAGLSCSCLHPGSREGSAYTSDILAGTPIEDQAGQDIFRLPSIPQAQLELVNGVGGMGFAIAPADGGGRGIVGTVDLADCGSQRTQLTPDWLAHQSWNEQLILRNAAASGADTADTGELVHTRWKVTRLSPIVSGSAVIECAEFGPHAYEMTPSARPLDARYGFARVAIVGGEPGR
ncbi:hypothetical protein [Rhodococcus sp. AG1013]|uniref:hypothetical protein n=1 Tax=unclassified Rhodococcus (in: high G+C Gram-positive bacteria) TaxID=192944 RepID=UPI000E0B7C48|nr:hypothetical protein [Rhodococcus sp. AG1013]RDI33714.1 hypothetical protein DEU38_10269 [Rhodococcus sp. AG1013]